MTLAVAGVLVLTGCSDDASACERLEELGGDPGPSAPLEQQRVYVEALAQCMEEESERGSQD